MKKNGIKKNGIKKNDFRVQNPLSKCKTTGHIFLSHILPDHRPLMRLKVINNNLYNFYYNNQ